MNKNQHIEKVANDLNQLQDQTLNWDQQAIQNICLRNLEDQSLAIKILSILGGFFAGLAFLGFIIALTGLFRTDSGITILGLICIGGSILLNKMYDKILLDTLSVTFFVAGFILLTFGLLSFDFSENTTSIIVMLFAGLSLGILSSYILNFISVLTINFAIAALILMNDINHFIPMYLSVLVLSVMYVFLNEAKLITHNRWLSIRYNSIRIGLVVSLISIFIILNQSIFGKLNLEYIWLSSTMIVCSILFLLSRIFNLLQLQNIYHQILIYVFILAILLPTILSPAMSGAILLLLLGFYVNHKVSFILGMIALVCFTGQYYYDLNFTLLTKSILLMISGMFLITLYFFIHKKLANQE